MQGLDVDASGLGPGAAVPRPLGTPWSQVPATAVRVAAVQSAWEVQHMEPTRDSAFSPCYWVPSLSVMYVDERAAPRGFVALACLGSTMLRSGLVAIGARIFIITRAFVPS